MKKIGRTYQSEGGGLREARRSQDGNEAKLEPLDKVLLENGEKYQTAMECTNEALFIIQKLKDQLQEAR